MIRVLLIALVSFQAASFLTSMKTLKDIHESHVAFQSWTKTTEKNYASTFEYVYRMYVFHINRLKIELHNQGNHSFTMELNNFADLTSEEFMAKYTNANKIPNPAQVEFSSKDEEEKIVTERKGDLKLDDYVNWVEKGMLNPIQNQGLCGSCYAFSSIATVEAAYAIANQGRLVKLSEQYLVNCGKDKAYMLFGCSGGMMEDTFKFYKNEGVFDDQQFPYSATEETCDLSAKPLFKISSYKMTSPQTMSQLLSEIMIGPVALSIEVTPSYQFYKAGIINIQAPCGFFLNHGVAAVGYNLKDSLPYLIIRNSYGESWGENGYFRFAIGDLSTSGNCAVANALGGRPIV